MKKFLNFLMAGFLAVLLNAKVFALMGVTDVKVSGRNATVVLDGYLKISKIKVLKRGSRIKIKLPVYVSRSGRVYPQAKFLNSALEDRVIQAIKTGKPVGSPSKRLSFKVTKMSLYEPKGKRSSLKAFSAVAFNNEIEVECKVMKGRKGPWVSWPSEKIEGKWVKVVNIIKPEIKKRIEKSVLTKFRKETSFKAEIIPGGKTLPLTVTDVEVTPVSGGGTTKAIASVVLNNAIKINEIKVKKIGGRTRLEYPVYVSRTNRVYPQVKILDPAFEKELISAIVKKEPSVRTSSKISYRISKYSPYTRPSTLKVFCSVIFNNKIEIECKIMEKNRGPWVSWPARPPEGGGRWIPQVEIKAKNLKEVIEKALLERYREESGEEYSDEY